MALNKSKNFLHDFRWYFGPHSIERSEESILWHQTRLRQIQDAIQDEYRMKKSFKRFSETFKTENQVKLAKEVIKCFPELDSMREIQIVTLSLLGKSSPQIASLEGHNVRPESVKFIKTRILKKTKIESFNRLLAKFMSMQERVNHEHPL